MVPDWLLALLIGILLGLAMLGLGPMIHRFAIRSTRAVSLPTATGVLVLATLVICFVRVRPNATIVKDGPQVAARVASSQPLEIASASMLPLSVPNFLDITKRAPRIVATTRVERTRGDVAAVTSTPEASAAVEEPVAVDQHAHDGAAAPVSDTIVADAHETESEGAAHAATPADPAHLHHDALGPVVPSGDHAAAAVSEDGSIERAWDTAWQASTRALSTGAKKAGSATARATSAAASSLKASSAKAARALGRVKRTVLSKFH